MGRAREILQKITPPEGIAGGDVSGSDTLFAEWKQDHALARVRHETGREPECQPSKVHTPKAKSRKAPAPKRIRERDLPF